MKTSKWTLLVMLAAGVGLTTLILLTRSPHPLATDVNAVTNANAPNQEVAQTEPVVDQTTPLAPTPVHQPVSVMPLTPNNMDPPAIDIASETAAAVRVRADQVLAKVNDRAILLADLVPLQPDEQEQAMTAEEYESRLNRAIEMELTFQAAATQGVDLTPEQKRRVEGVARRHEATLQEYGKQGFTWSSLTLAQVEFEQRLTAALLLQQNLVALEAGVAPASAPALQARYEQARSEVLNRLRAFGNVSVSTAEL